MKKLSFLIYIFLQANIINAQSWSLTGNSGTNPGTNFIGTTDGKVLVLKTNNQQAGYLGFNTSQARVALGYQALLKATGGRNSGFGYRALYLTTSGAGNTAAGAFALSGNTTGNNNTAIGALALYNNKSGSSNVAIGVNALNNNTVGHNLVAVGDSALFNQSLGTYPVCEFCDTSRLYQNTAIGSKALFRNTSGYYNTATGFEALYWNGTSHDNTANGFHSLYNNLSGSANTAMGSHALEFNVGGYSNTAVGYNALVNNNASNNTATGNLALNQNYNGIQNSAFGDGALYFNYSGSYNTGVGYNTLGVNTNQAKNTAIGWSAGAFHTSSACTFVGHKASSTVDAVDNSTAIGFLAFVTASNQVRIGSDYVTSIGGYAGWSNISDGRVKKNIKANVPGLEFINKLSPVTYNLDLEAADKILQRSANDKEGKLSKPDAKEISARKAKEQIVYTGFVAQDVEKVAKALNYDFSGIDAAKNSKDLYGLRYAEFVVPLVKAVQELSTQNDKLKAKNEELEARLTKVEALITANPGGEHASEGFLNQNVPNPAVSTTVISYYTPFNGEIRIADIKGSVVKSYTVGKGAGQININSAELATGTYVYTLYSAGKVIETKRMIVSR